MTLALVHYSIHSLVFPHIKRFFSLLFSSHLPSLPFLLHFIFLLFQQDTFFALLSRLDSFLAATLTSFSFIFSFLFHTRILSLAFFICLSLSSPFPSLAPRHERLSSREAAAPG